MRRLLGMTITVGLLVGGLAAVAAPAVPAAAASPPTVSIGNGEGDESVAGKPGKIRIPVTLSDPSPTTVTVDWTFVPTGEPGAATEDDVIKTSGTVTFKPSARTGLTATTKYVTVRAVPDGLFEGPQQFEIELSNPSSGYVLDRNPGFGLVGEPTGPNYITARPAAIVEGDTGTKNTLKVPIVLGGPLAVPVTVDMVVTGGNATPDLDYKAITPKTIAFKPGQVRKNLNIAVTPDTISEPLEEITFALTNHTGGALIGTSQFTVTIFDDDEPGSEGGLVIDTPADTHDYAPGDGFCADANGACSLRAAVDELNAAPPTPAVIELAASPELSIAGPNDDLNISGDIDIRVPNVEIRGNGRRIDANGIDRVLHVLANGSFTLLDVTIAGGDAPPSTDAQATVIGGGVYAPTSSLSITNSNVLGNLARREVCPPGCTSTQWRGSGGGVVAASVDVTDSLISNNQAASEGGGIWSGGTVTVQRSAMTYNAVATPSPCGCVQQGGGIRAGALTIVESTLDRNSSDGTGGAGYVRQSDVTVQRSAVTNNTAASVGGLFGVGTGGSIADSTFSGNAGGALGLVVVNTRAAIVNRSTFVGNPGAPTIWFAGVACPSPSPGCNPSLPAVLSIGRTILQPASGQVACALGSPALPNLEAAVDGGSNLISNGGACTFGDPADPMVGPLADNGGPTWTHLPQPGSPAINSSGACAGVDQRGVTRPQGVACDIGAVEVVSSGPVVNTSTDTHDAAPGDGVCGDGAGACSLRAAVDEINVGSAPRVIELAASPRLGLPGVDDDLNASGDIDVRVSDVEIRGNGHTIDARGIDRAIDASASGVTGLKVIETTITGGHVDATSAAGGGIRANDLTVTDTTVTANFAGGGGGGISAAGLTVSDSTISENSTNTGFPPLFGAGGGISASAPVRISGTTIAGNDATVGGGLNASGDVEIDNTTFSANHAALTGSGAALRQFFTAIGHRLTNTTFVGNTGGATIEFSAPTCVGGPVCPPPPGVLTITRSIIVSPTAPACSLGTFDNPSSQSVVDGGSNLISNGGACTFGSPADPMLGPLADNGGPTWTHLPQPGSPAIDGGGACTGADQRGVSRPQDTACDIGAVEIES